MNDRNKYIFEQLNRHYEEAKKLGYEIFALVLQGSQNYGLDIYRDDYKSDVDTKLIVLPTLDDLIEERKPISYTHLLDNNKYLYKVEKFDYSNTLKKAGFSVNRDICYFDTHDRVDLIESQSDYSAHLFRLLEEERNKKCF